MQLSDPTQDMEQLRGQSSATLIKSLGRYAKASVLPMTRLALQLGREATVSSTLTLGTRVRWFGQAQTFYSTFRRSRACKSQSIWTTQKETKVFEGALRAFVTL